MIRPASPEDFIAIIFDLFEPFSRATTYRLGQSISIGGVSPAKLRGSSGPKSM